MEFVKDLTVLFEHLFEKDPQEKPAIHIAAYFGYKHCVEYLIQICGVDLNRRVLEMTALHVACLRENLEVVEILLSYPDTDINAKTRIKYFSPMLIALCKGNAPLMRMLANNSRLDETSVYSPQFMVIAASAGVDCLNVVITHYIQIFGSLGDSLAKDMLKYAGMHGEAESVRYLLDNVNFDPSKGSGLVAVFKMCGFGEINVLKVVLDHPRVCLDRQLEKSKRPICIYLVIAIAREGHVPSLKCVLETVKHLLGIQDIPRLYAATEFVLKQNYSEVFKLMLELITDIILSAAETQRTTTSETDASQNDEYVYVDVMQGLMTASLKSCVKAIPQTVNKYWDKIRKQINAKEILNCYMVAYFPYLYANQQAGHSNHILILYYAMRLGLTDHVKKILKLFPRLHKKLRNNIPGKKLTIFQCSMQNKNIRDFIIRHFKAKEYQLCASETQTYANWYSFLKKLSSSLSDAPHHKITSKENNIIVDWVYRSLEEQEKCPEFNQVCQTVDQFMHALSEMIATENPLLYFKPVLAGSESERTRPFIPNEFDYLLVLKTLAEKCVIEAHCPKKFMLKVTEERYKINPFLRDITSETGYVEIPQLKLFLKHAFKKVLFKLATRPCLENIVVEPHCYEGGENKRIHCMQITWRGDIYKDMKISIDLVPAFEHKEYVPTNQPGFQCFGKCTYYIFTKFFGDLSVDEQGSTAMLPIAFSTIEGRIIRSLPDDLRKGFMLAKALRRASLFSGEIVRKIAERVYDIEDYLPTYMLKTCTFIIAQEYGLFNCGTGDFPKWSPLMWALQIYKRLLDFLVAGHVPLFFSLVSQYLENTDFSKHDSVFSCKEPRKDESNKKSCCFRRDNLILITEHMISVISTRLFHQGQTSVNSLLSKI